jgi:hypothetical protein
MSLSTPESVRKLRAALHAKAKASPNQRFHALDDKVYRSDVLVFAYRCCRANGGASGTHPIHERHASVKCLQNRPASEAKPQDCAA